MDTAYMAKKKKTARKKFDAKPRLMKGGRQVMGALERIQKLQEQIEEAKNAALEELREKRKTAQQALADVEKEISDLTGTKTSKSGIRRMRDPNKPCPICGQTGHDGRFHRGQSKKKK